MEHYNQLKELMLHLLPKYAQEVPVPYEPPQSFLLGNRWADFGLAGVFALGLPVLRSILRSTVYTPLGMLFMFKGIKTKLTGKQQDRLKKWNESCWKLTMFLTFTITALAVSIREPWFWETRYFWLGCNAFPPCNLSVSKGVLLFYAIESGFYAQSIHFLLFHEVRRKDWLESMIHHVATLCLLLYSYYVNFARVGVMILLVHDASDIFLEGAKLARYARRQTLATVIFVLFMLVWIITRNFIFPFVLIRSTLSEPLFYAAKYNIETEPHYTIFNGLLVLLEILHIYWTYLIMQVAWRQVTVGKTHDVREQDNSDDDDD